MAKFVNNIDLLKNELQNARIQNLATAPSSPVEGQIYYDTDDNAIYFWDGTAWVSTKDADIPYGESETTTIGIEDAASDGDSPDLARADHVHAGPGFGNVTEVTTYNASPNNGSAITVARSDHSHGTPAHTDTEHSEIHLNALADPTGNVSMNEHRITDLADPTDPQDAATKFYVDAAITGLDWKSSAHLLADVNVALTGTSGTLVIDGHDALGDSDDGYRILLINQTTSSEDGIYVYSDNGSTYTLTRPADADTYQELIGAAIFIKEGTVYGATSWVQVDHYLSSFADQEWVQFSGQGTYTASDGVELTGNNFTFDYTSTGGLEASTSGAYIKLQTNSGLGTTSDGLAVGAGTGISVSGGNVAIDTSVVARKYSTLIGNGTTNPITVTHNLGTKDVMVSIREVSSTDIVYADVQISTNDEIVVSFAVAPTSNQYSVTVIG
jgi:hypothetical protein